MAGHEVTEALDGESGIAAVKRVRPQVVICDVQLPGISGYDVAAALKQDAETSGIPLVAVTAFAMVGDRERILRQGFDGYIAKPIEPTTFASQVEAAARLGPGPARASAGRARARSPRVLVVDNSAANLEVISGMLEPFGYQVMRARSGEEALTLAAADPPDIVLCDVHMPGMDGFAFIREVKSREGLRSVPCVFLSSGGDAEAYARQARALGASGFLSRPFEPRALLQTLRRHLAPDE